MAESGCLKDGHFQNLQVEGNHFNTNNSGVSTPALTQIGVPLSGTSGDHAGTAPQYALCLDTQNNVLYVNEGTATSPYWSPTNIHDIGLRGVSAQLKGGDGEHQRAIDNTSAATIVGHHVRVFGDGISEADSGIVADGGAATQTSNLTTTNADAHVIALSLGPNGTTLLPSTNGPLVIDIEFTNDVLTNRSIFLGFQDLSIDALVEPCTGATTIITFNPISVTCDNICGMFLDTGLSVTDKYFLVYNKDDASPNFETSVSVGGPTNGVGQVAAADGTMQRLRMQVDASGNITAFIDKAQVGTVVTAMNPAKPLVPVFCLGAIGSNPAVAKVKHFEVFASQTLT